jgi:hypothetical protein
MTAPEINRSTYVRYRRLEDRLTLSLGRGFTNHRGSLRWQARKHRRDEIRRLRRGLLRLVDPGEVA